MAVIDTRGGSFQNLPQTLLQMLVTKNQQEQAQADFKLRRQNFELEQEKFQDEKAIAERDRQNQIAGARGILSFLAQANPQAAQALQGVPEGGLPSAVEGTLSAMQSTAQARATNVQADTGAFNLGVAQETRPALVARPEAELQGLLANTANTVARTAGQELNNTLMSNVLRNDPERGRTFISAWQGGQITAGQARELAGLGPIEGLPDNAVFVPPSTNATGTENARKAASFFQLMQTSDGLINGLVQGGTRLEFLPSLQRQTQNSFLDAAINSVIDPKQRQLVQAQRMFGDAYRFSLSGQQSSDREALRMLNSIAEQVGDDDATIGQKRILRRVMMQATLAVANGAVTPTQAATQGLQAARASGAPEETISLFEDILTQARTFEAGSLSSAAPADPNNTFGGVSDAINRGLGR